MKKQIPPTEKRATHCSSPAQNRVHCCSFSLSIINCEYGSVLIVKILESPTDRRNRRIFDEAFPVSVLAFKTSKSAQVCVHYMPPNAQCKLIGEVKILFYEARTSPIARLNLRFTCRVVYSYVKHVSYRMGWQFSNKAAKSCVVVGRASVGHYLLSRRWPSCPCIRKDTNL